MHAVVARSTFRSQNAKNTRGSDHVWKLRCWKSARRCGAKHVSMSTVLKNEGLGALFDVQLPFSVAGARGSARCQKWIKYEGFIAFSTTITTRPYYTTTTLHYIPPHYTTRHYTPLHWITLRYTYNCKIANATTLHYIKLDYTNHNYNYTRLHYTTLIKLHYTTLHYTPLHPPTPHYTQLHYTTLHYIALHKLHCTTLHYTILQHSTPHYTQLHYTTLPHPTLHYITLHSLHHRKCNCNYTALITLYHIYNSFTLQLQLQLHYTTLHSEILGEVTDQMTTAAIATPQKYSSNHLSVHQWIRSAIRNSQQSISPIRFLFLKLPPPPCAVLVVFHSFWSIYIFDYLYIYILIYRFSFRKYIYKYFFNYRLIFHIFL